jgi:hypothetical protein
VVEDLRGLCSGYGVTHRSGCVPHRQDQGQFLAFEIEPGEFAAVAAGEVLRTDRLDAADAVVGMVNGVTSADFHGPFCESHALLECLNIKL